MQFQKAIHTHPKEGGNQKFLGEGILKTKSLTGINFQGGMGRCKKTLLLGEIFSGTVQCLTDALLMGVNIIHPSRETTCLGIS